MPNWVNKLVPWVLSLVIVGFLVATTDMDAFSDALGRADWLLMVGGMAAVTVVAWLADSGTLWLLFRRFVVRDVTAREVVTIKGVSYFLNAITYSLAAAGMAWFLHKRFAVRFMTALSALIWFFFVDIIALTVMLSLGMLVAPDALAASSVADQLPMLVAVLWVIIAGSLIYWVLRFDFFVFRFFRSWRMFEVFGRAQLIDYLRFVPLRVAFISIYVVMHAILLPAFGVHIPLANLLLYAPLIAFVQVIPATISGLGAVQGVMVPLFAIHVAPELGDPHAVILAYSTVIGPLISVLRLVIGYAFVSRVSADLVPTSEQVEQAKAAIDEPQGSAGPR